MTRAAFAAAVLLYAAFSSPTPDAPGVVEYLVLGLLIVSCAHLVLPRDRWVLPLTALLAYGLGAPLLIGVMAGNAAGDIARDLIAFAAIAVPLVYAHLFSADDARAQNLLLILLLGVGLLFSMRYLAGTWQSLSSLGMAPLDHNLLYLANSPLVAFAAVFLVLQGCFVQTRPHVALGMVAVSFIPLAAMVGMMQRATLALLALVWLVFFFAALVKNPKRAGVIALVLALTVAVLWPLPALTVQALTDKTLAVGWNARGAELATLLDAIAQNPLTAVFGTGWGSLVRSPAVGDQWVRFSHGFFTALLWKTGWLGLAVGAAGIGALLADAAQRLRKNAALAAALILPLLPALFLYGSYKSLCFGLLLLGLIRLDWTASRLK